jgi:hypothetical protein
MRKLLSLLIGCVFLALSASAQPLDQSPESFVDTYLKAWAAGDFQTTYACLSSEMKKGLSFEKHVKSLASSVQTDEQKENLAQHRVTEVAVVEGKNGVDPMRKRVVVEYKDGSQAMFMLLSEAGHWKLNGP